VLILNTDNNSVLFINKISMYILILTISINNLNRKIIFFTQTDHLVKRKTTLILWFNISNKTQILKNLETAIIMSSVYILDETPTHDFYRILLCVTFIWDILHLYNIVNSKITRQVKNILNLFNSI
jgi:hypothetical protein